MSMNKHRAIASSRGLILAISATLLAGSVVVSAGCHEEKKTTKIKVEGPEREHEVKIERTEDYDD